MTSSGAQRQPLPLAAQLAKLERILADRIKLYRLSVKKGGQSLDEAAEKHAECGDILRSFRWLVANHDWIRPLAQRRLEEQRLREDVESDPAAQALIEQFPDATVDVHRMESDA